MDGYSRGGRSRWRALGPREVCHPAALATGWAKQVALGQPRTRRKLELERVDSRTGDSPGRSLIGQPCPQLELLSDLADDLHGLGQTALGTDPRHVGCGVAPGLRRLQASLPTADRYPKSRT